MDCFGDIYFWRQSIVLITDCIHSVGIGLMLSFPAVLNPAILNPNSTGIHATPEQASWIAASQGISGVIGFCLVPPVMQTLGRKLVNIGMNIFYAVGFLVFALANDIPALYAARIIQGVMICDVYITPIILGEYSDPKRRGYFISLKKASVAVGSLICHSLDLCWTWKQIAIFSIVPHVIAVLMTFIWPESPAFLALNDKYNECNESCKWLYGDSPLGKQQFEELVAAQEQRRQLTKNNTNAKMLIMKMLRKDFMKPFLIVSLMTMIIDACGRYYMLTYIVQMLTEITKDKSVALYCTLGSDLLTIIALTMSSLVIRWFKRRTIFFTSGMISVILMLLVSVMTLAKSYIGVEDSVLWLTPSMILLNVFIVNVGVIPTCFVITGEIFPLEHKGTGLIGSGIIFTILYAIVLKFTPLMMERTGVHGTFGIYGFCEFVGLIILYFILNETKDKTLQEIENEIKGIRRIKSSYLNQKPLMET